MKIRMGGMSRWKHKKAAIRKQSFYGERAAKKRKKNFFKCMLKHMSVSSMKIMLYELFRKFVSSFREFFTQCWWKTFPFISMNLLCCLWAVKFDTTFNLNVWKANLTRYFQTDLNPPNMLNICATQALSISCLSELRRKTKNFFFGKYEKFSWKLKLFVNNFRSFKFVRGKFFVLCCCFAAGEEKGED